MKPIAQRSREDRTKTNLAEGFRLVLWGSVYLDLGFNVTPRLPLFCIKLPLRTGIPLARIYSHYSR